MRVTDWSLGDSSSRNNHVKTDATHETFRNLKLKDFDREAMPTGYCRDIELQYAFIDGWKKHGSAWVAFNAALDEFVRAVAADVDYAYSAEAIAEFIEMNEYTFTESGRRV
ncbi:MAG: hypothetical protein KGL63_06570 [Betaproteobacteria bacterium]|nr:hypothetical protein [Betaproteobacteria bacterium]